jgi:hypothetical protein
VDLIEPDHSQKEADYGSIPFTTARGLEDCPEIQAALEQRKAECRNTYLRQSRNKQASLILSATERTFLGHMCLNEYEPINRLFMRMGNPSPATQQKIIDRLVELDLIEALQIRISKSPIRLGYPTTAGWNYVNAQPRFKPLRGGLVHTHICRWKQALDMRGGCDECICEFPIPNTTGFSDVATKINGVWRCTEVVVDCTSNICHHVRDCLISSSDIESLTIVTLLKSEHEDIRTKIISNTDLVDLVSRIGFATVGQILKDLYE